MDIHWPSLNPRAVCRNSETWPPEWAKLLRGQPHSGGIRALEFAANGKTLATSGSDRTIRFWDVDTLAEQNTLVEADAEVVALAFTPGGRTIVSIDRANALSVWDVAIGQIVFALGPIPHPLVDLRFSPDGSTLASRVVGHAGLPAIHLWLGTEQGLKWRRRVCASADEQPPTARRGMFVANGQELLVLDGHTGPVRAIAFSPDGRMLASCGDGPDGGIEVIAWFAEGMVARVIRELPTHKTLSRRSQYVDDVPSRGRDTCYTLGSNGPP